MCTTDLTQLSDRTPGRARSLDRQADPGRPIIHRWGCPERKKENSKRPVVKRERLSKGWARRVKIKWWHMGGTGTALFFFSPWRQVETNVRAARGGPQWAPATGRHRVDVLTYLGAGSVRLGICVCQRLLMMMQSFKVQKTPLTSCFYGLIWCSIMHAPVRSCSFRPGRVRVVSTVNAPCNWGLEKRRHVGSMHACPSRRERRKKYNAAGGGKKKEWSRYVSISPHWFVSYTG
jgi:hypothetical protein